MESSPNQPPLIVVMGETASGKTALALALAGRFNGEIIAADSWSVYKGFDIGTAKPTAAERNRVPHHLLDVADPVQGFSAPQYQRMALAAIADISARGALPIMAGGTGLYIDSVLFNYSFLPPGSAAARRALNQRSIADLLDEVRRKHINTADIDLRNKRRLIRLIETNGQRPHHDALRQNTLLLGLSVPREELRERVAERTDAMLRAGLEREVSGLAARYGWDAEPMRGIGYQEFRPYFSGEISLSDVRSRIIRDTLALAKRQRTWFKRNKSIHWLSNLEESVALITTFLNKKIPKQ